MRPGSGCERPNFFDLWAATDQEIVYDAARKLEAGEVPREFEAVLVSLHGNRSTVTIRMTACNSAEHSPQIFLAHLTPVSGYKSMENRDPYPRAGWEQIFDALPDLIAVLDEKHKVQKVNKAMAQRLGVSVSELVGRHCYECVHGLHTPVHGCPHAKSLSDCLNHRLEIHEKHLGGDFLITTTPILDAGGRNRGSIHVARDITELKKTQESLRNQTRFLEKLIDTIPIPVFYKEAGGIFRGCNSAFATFVDQEKSSDSPELDETSLPEEMIDFFETEDDMDPGLGGVRVLETRIQMASGEKKGMSSCIKPFFTMPGPIRRVSSRCHPGYHGKKTGGTNQGGSRTDHPT